MYVSTCDLDEDQIPLFTLLLYRYLFHTYNFFFLFILDLVMLVLIASSSLFRMIAQIMGILLPEKAFHGIKNKNLKSES